VDPAVITRLGGEVRSMVEPASPCLRREASFGRLRKQFRPSRQLRATKDEISAYVALLQEKTLFYEDGHR